MIQYWVSPLWWLGETPNIFLPITPPDEGENQNG
nr:MAG TPA: hypothetical protein [Caudoviricetes sp.]